VNFICRYTLRENHGPSGHTWQVRPHLPYATSWILDINNSTSTSWMNKKRWFYVGLIKGTRLEALEHLSMQLNRHNLHNHHQGAILDVPPHRRCITRSLVRCACTSRCAHTYDRWNFEQPTWEPTCNRPRTKDHGHPRQEAVDHMCALTYNQPPQHSTDLPKL
jgi:hypothetical protein